MTVWLDAQLSPALAMWTIGVLRVGDGKLWFVEQIGQVDRELDLANVKRVGAVNGGLNMMNAFPEEGAGNNRACGSVAGG